MKDFKKILKIAIYIIVVIISFGCGVYVGMFDTVSTSKHGELNQTTVQEDMTQQMDVENTNSTQDTPTTHDMNNRGFTPIS